MIGHFHPLSPIVTWDPIDRAHPSNRGLAAWYPVVPGLDGGRQISDVFGITPLTIAGATWATASRPGGAGSLAFGGTGNASIASPIVAAVPLAFAAWVRVAAPLPTATATDMVVCAAYQVGGLSEFWLAINTVGDGTGVRVRAVAQNSTNRINAPLAPGVDDGNWHHVAAVFQDASNYPVYLDGVPLATNYSGAASMTPASIDSAAVGGFTYNTTTFYGGFNGNIEDARFNRIAPSASEVVAVYRLSREGYPGVWNRSARPMPRPGVTSVTLGAAALMMGA